MLNIKLLLVQILKLLTESDAIIEQGTRSGWKYRMWKKGTVEAWYTGNTTVAADNAWNSMFYHSYPTSLSYPSSLFATVKNLQMQIRTGNGLWWVQPQSIGTTYIPFYIISTRNSSTTADIDAYLVGTWE